MFWHRYGEVRCVKVSCVRAGFGWRVMARLRAVLCGTVMYGLVRLARFVSLWFVAVCNGKEWLARLGMVV